MNKITHPTPANKPMQPPDGQVVLYAANTAGKGPRGNALIVGGGGITMNEELDNCSAILKNGKMADGRVATGYWAEQAFSVCDMIRYVFVTEEGAVSYPQLNPTAKTYTPGSYKGKVHGYDLEKGEYFGSADVEATMPKEMTNYQGQAHAIDNLNGRFRSAAYTGVKIALKKAIPTIDLN